MSTREYASKLMARYEPQVPIPELVEQLNRFYHANEARLYDHQHPEIHEQIGPLWKAMLDVGLGASKDRPLRVLDFGCGTGFEATRLLQSRHGDSVGQLVCYDLSPEMLEVCRDRLAAFSCSIDYLSDFDALHAEGEPFDVLLTNSLLHHLPEPFDTIGRLSGLLSPEAVWLAGHEPSCRFYRNPSCCDVLEAYRHDQRFRRYLSPSKYAAKITNLLRMNRDPARGAALAAVEEGLVLRRPSALAIERLVDFHVAHCTQEANAGRGFDFLDIKQQLDGQWDLSWHKTYSFMGSIYEGHLPKRWLDACRRLEQAHPDDGSNFCAVWKRPPRE